MRIKHFTLLMMATILIGCTCQDKTQCSKIDLILDSDANNELDDQHAIAYMLLNQDTYNPLGITINGTKYGGDATEQAKEAERVAKMVGKYGENVKIIAGASNCFDSIVPNIANDNFDGVDAVNFIIESAKKYNADNKLNIVAVGKLTNIALALAKNPTIKDNIRLLWLGSNYPAPGEYNLINDIPSLVYVLDQDIEMGIALVHPDVSNKYGTTKVNMQRWQVQEYIAGKGPKVQPVEGRYDGRTFTCFGDYSLDLFDQCSHDNTYTRSIHDMVAVAILAHPEWSKRDTIPAPTMVDGQFVDRPSNTHKITLWYNFNLFAIIQSLIDILDETTDK